FEFDTGHAFSRPRVRIPTLMVLKYETRMTQNEYLRDSAARSPSPSDCDLSSSFDRQTGSVGGKDFG
ncbi:MAG: hypothetical protein AAFX40_14480, partial [Cyanobacteria bacterium J06639_1]